MKKLAIILAACAMLACAFTSCGDSSSGSDESKKSSSSASESASDLKQKELNATASTLEKTFGSAITDADAKGQKIYEDDSNRVVIYTSKGNFNAANEADIMKAARNYFDDIDYIQYIVVIEDYKVTAVYAAEAFDSEVIGVYPEDAELPGKTLDEILTALKK